MQHIGLRLIASVLLLMTSASWAENYTEKPMPIQPEQQKEQIKQVDSVSDSDRETKMIMLNQQLNKKGNKVEQTTHEVKSRHNTEQSIINNLK